MTEPNPTSIPQRVTWVSFAGLGLWIAGTIAMIAICSSSIGPAWGRLGWTLPIYPIVALSWLTFTYPEKRAREWIGWTGMAAALALAAFGEWEGIPGLSALAVLLLMLAFGWTLRFSGQWSGWVAPALLFAIPWIVGLSQWDHVIWLTYRSAAWETSAILDGLEIANYRNGNVVQVAEAELNMEWVSRSPWGFELAISLVGLYAFLFRRSWMASVSLILAGWFLWVNWQSVRWVAWAYQIEHFSAEWEWVVGWVSLPTVVTLVSLPFLDALIRAVLEPMDESAIASEFPWFIRLFNDVATFPCPANAEWNRWREPFLSPDGEEAL